MVSLLASLVPMSEAVRSWAIVAGQPALVHLAMQGRSAVNYIEDPAGPALLALLVGAGMVVVGRRRNLRWLRIGGHGLLGIGVLVILMTLLVMLGWLRS
jgi:hypothetical protein